MAAYLSFKEIWRNKGRYLLFSLVIALITVLVLFTAGLGEGLASANKEYLEKINADLLVFQEDTGFSTLESRLEYNTLKQVRRWEGVADVGAIGFSNVTILFKNGAEPVEVSLIGVEPGKPGAPPAFEGEALRSKQSKTTVIDGRIAEQANVQVGDTIIVKTTQGAEDEFYELKVNGITDGRQYFFQPSVFVPLEIWDEIRPKGIPIPMPLRCCRIYWQSNCKIRMPKLKWVTIWRAVWTASKLPTSKPPTRPHRATPNNKARSTR